jgi:ABC-type polysaccharide/polyol phosphate export permease
VASTVEAPRGADSASIADPAATGKPVVAISPASRSLSVATLRELWEFREVLWAFAVRAVKVKYKQAVIGVGWALIQPILAALVFALIFGRLAKLETGDGSPYLLFVLCGMTCWTYTNTAITTAAQSLVTDQTLLRKVYFPREVIPFGAIVAALVDFGPALGVLLVVAAMYGEYPALSWVLLPVLLLTLVILAAGVSLILAGLNVYYRDVKHAIPFLLQLGLFASAIVYPLSLIDEPWATVYGIANPIAGVIEGVRQTVSAGNWPDPLLTVGGLVWASVVFVAGYALFERLERNFGDRV